MLFFCCSQQTCSCSSWLKGKPAKKIEKREKRKSRYTTALDFDQSSSWCKTAELSADPEWTWRGWEEHICTEVLEVQSDWDPSDPDISPSDQLKTHLKKMLHHAKAAQQSNNSYCPATAGRRLLIQPQAICMSGTDEWNTSAGEKNPFPRYTKVQTPSNTHVACPKQTVTGTAVWKGGALFDWTTVRGENFIFHQPSEGTSDSHKWKWKL